MIARMYPLLFRDKLTLLGNTMHSDLFFDVWNIRKFLRIRVLLSFVSCLSTQANIHIYSYAKERNERITHMCTVPSVVRPVRLNIAKQTWKIIYHKYKKSIWKIMLWNLYSKERASTKSDVEKLLSLDFGSCSLKALTSNSV